MTSPTLPVTRLVNVQVNLTPSAAGAQDLSAFLIIGSSGVINTVERFRTYTSIAAVAADFGTVAPEYLAAVLWFEQQPQPSQLMIGRWGQNPSSGQLIGATLSAQQQNLSNFTSITSGGVKYAIDGGSRTDTSPINLSGVLNLSGVAAAVTALLPGAVVIWNSVYQRFEVTSNTSGAASSVGFMQTPASTTDLSSLLGLSTTNSGAYVTQGAVAETALACISFFDLNYGQLFYGFTMIGTADADILAVAPFINASGNKHLYFVTTQEAGVLTSAVTSDIASMLQALSLLRVWVQYSSTNPYAAVSAAARLLTTNYTGNNTVITLFYKQEPGITAESLNSAQVNALEAKNCNVFVNYNNNTAIIETSATSNGTFIDVVAGTDWLALTIQAAVYNLLYTSGTKVPQTDQGMHLMLNAIEGVCAQGVLNGLLAPGQWNSGGFGNLALGDFMVKGYYVYAPPVSSQSQQDRAARKAVPIQVAAKLAGAVQTVAMTINVNQ